MSPFSFALWQKRIKRIFRSSRPSQQGTRVVHFRPTLLQLEDRVVPTVNLGTHFTGLQYSNSGGVTPPDTNAAVGQTNIIETVNNAIALYSKSGGGALVSEPQSTFFKSVITGNSLSDSVVAYDEQTQQFFVGVLDLNVSIFGTVNSDQFDYAVSKPGADPTASNFASDFSFYSVPLTNVDPAGSGSYFADFPRLGWNANAFVVSFNMFTTGFSEVEDHPLILNISTSNPGTTQVVDVPGGIANSTVVPAVMHGSSSTDPMYLVEETLDPATGNPTGNSISVVTESNLFNSNGTAPTFATTPISVDAYTAPPNATQKGATTTLQTNDSRILNAEWRNGTLVAAQDIGVSTDSQAHARWYQFATSATTAPTLVQDGTIGVGSGANSYFPAIAIDPKGDLGMSYMESSSTEYVSMYVTGRTPSDQTGQMETPVLAQAGQAAYSGFDGSPYRAGDFSGITVDPTNGNFWAANEYATTVSSAQSTNWGTALAQLTISAPVPPPTVTTAASASPSPVIGKTTNLSVTATDPSGENLTYHWSVTSGPSGVTFTGNDQTLASGATDGSSSNPVVATFTQAGNYTFQVTITDSSGANTTSTVKVTVNQTLTSLSVSPATASLKDGHSQAFTATALDQFGKAMASQPTSFAWTVTGGGTLSPSTTNRDTYTAPKTGSGSATITVTAGGVSGTASVTYHR